MRKTRHISGSLQKQLLIYMILIALIPALFLLFWYFDYVRSSTVMQLGQDNGRMLAHAVDKLVVVAEQVNEFVLWISQNEQIDVLLNRTENDLQYDETMHSAMEQLREQIYYRPIAQELSALYILGANGLDLRCGPDSSLIDPAQLEQAIRVGSRRPELGLSNRHTRWTFCRTERDFLPICGIRYSGWRYKRLYYSAVYAGYPAGRVGVAADRGDRQPGAL